MGSSGVTGGVVFFSSRRRHTSLTCDWSSDVCSSDLPGQNSDKIADEVRSAVQVAEITKWRNTKLPAGPNVDSSDSIIIVEGRNDVVNLLKCGIKNAIAVEGTSVPDEVKELTKEKTTILFVDGDRGGELIAKEILQTCEVDFVARAPPTREVEELPHKLVMKCLKNKLTAEQFTSQMGIVLRKDGAEGGEAPRSERREGEGRPEGRSERPMERRDDGRREGGEPRGERRDDGRREGGRDDRRDGGRGRDRRGRGGG